VKISTKGRYGLRAMVDMAINSLEEYTPLNVIAERQNISGNYLEQVFSLLKKADLVKSIRGSQGGYALSRKPSNISVGEVLRVLEGELSITKDTEVVFDKDNYVESCINTAVWQKVNRSINDVVDSITLEQLVYDYKKNSEIYNFDYVI
jgi:Rrf2 family protein